jgi:prepilin-type processing-associated H-X9-DG protein
MERMKNLGMGIQLYTQDHDGEFPRSSHSASTYRESGWTESVLPYLNIPLPSSTEGWQQVVNQYHRCPSDRRHGPYDFSYGLNVYFELDPEGDDYLGSPTQWRKTIAIPKLSRTILLAELPETEGADHFMCHQWSNIRGASNAVAAGRHKGRANYLFADGHIEAMALSQTFISRTNNLWNPSVAR